MNPNEIIAMIRSGANPQQLVMQMLQAQMGNTPMGKNLLNLAQKGDAAGIELIARNLAAQRGIDYDKEFEAFKQTLGL